MKPVSLVAVAVALASLGCSDNPVVPTEGLETVQAVVLRHRTAASNEIVPRFDAVGSAEGKITIRVTTHAACGTRVSAQANRDATDGVMDVIARVSSDPAANCIPIPVDFVADYEIVVPTPAIRFGSTTIRVNFFEMHETQAPEFLGRQAVVVCCSA